MSENDLLDKIKTIFLFFLTFLVFVNTVILISVIPALGNYFTPHSQEAIAAWAIVRLTMESCMVVIIMLGVAYGTVKVLNWRNKRDGV